MALTQRLSVSIFILIAVVLCHLPWSTSFSTQLPKHKISRKISPSSTKTDSSTVDFLRNNFTPLPKPENPLSDSPYLHQDSAFYLQNDGFSIPGTTPMELINLGTPHTSISPCATILTTTNCILQVPDDAVHKDIHYRHFTFAAGLIKDQCSLTVQDCSGSYATFMNYLFPSGGVCNTAASVCCECNGCSRPDFPLYENSCAALFEHEKCSLCNGFRLEVIKGDKIAWMNPFVDNRVSSIFVVPGCELKVFQDPDFQGLAAAAQGSLDYLPSEWNDKISSFECDCSYNSVSTVTPTTFPSTPDPVHAKTSPITTTEQPIESPTNSPQPHSSTEQVLTSTARSTMKSTTLASEGESTTTKHTYVSTTESEGITTTTAKSQGTTVDASTELTTEFDDKNYVY